MTDQGVVVAPDGVELLAALVVGEAPGECGPGTLDHHVTVHGVNRMALWRPCRGARSHPRCDASAGWDSQIFDP